MTEKPKETPKEELECPKKYVYDTGILFECKDNIKVEIIGEDVVDLLNEQDKTIKELGKENEQFQSEVSKLTDLLASEIEKNAKLLQEINSLKIENMRLKEEIKDLNDVLARYEENMLNGEGVQFRDVSELEKRYEEKELKE